MARHGVASNFSSNDCSPHEIQKSRLWNILRTFPSNKDHDSLKRLIISKLFKVIQPLGTTVLHASAIFGVRQTRQSIPPASKAPNKSYTYVKILFASAITTTTTTTYPSSPFQEKKKAPPWAQPHRHHLQPTPLHIPHPALSASGSQEPCFV